MGKAGTQLRIAAALAGFAAVAMSDAAGAVGPDMFSAEWGSDAPVSVVAYATTNCTFGVVNSCSVSALASPGACFLFGQVAGVPVAAGGCEADLTGSWGEQRSTDVSPGPGSSTTTTETCTPTNYVLDNGQLTFKTEPVELYTLKISVTIGQSTPAVRTVTRSPNAPAVEVETPGTMRYAGAGSDVEGHAWSVAGGFQFQCDTFSFTAGYGGTLGYQ